MKTMNTKSDTTDAGTATITTFAASNTIAMTTSNDTSLFTPDTISTTLEQNK